MKFNYARYGSHDTSRPIIPVLLRNPYSTTGALASHALVDSGADFCVFSGELATLLDIDLTKGEQQMVGGVVSGESRAVYFHLIEVEVPPFGGGERLLIKAGFMPELSDTGHGILGRRDFFSALTFVKFRDWNEELELGKVRR